MNNIPLTNEAIEADWIATLPENLREAGKRYGRELFSFAMTTGIVGSGFERLTKWAGRNKDIMSTLQVLATHVNQVSLLLIESKGWTVELLESCRKDIEDAAGPVEQSRIILPH